MDNEGQRPLDYFVGKRGDARPAWRPSSALIALGFLLVWIPWAVLMLNVSMTTQTNPQGSMTQGDRLQYFCLMILPILAAVGCSSWSVSHRGMVLRNWLGLITFTLSVTILIAFSVIMLDMS